MNSKKKQSWLIQAVGIIISIVCIVYVLRQVDLDDLKTAFLHFNWAYLMVGVLSLAVGYAFRIIRWGVMLRSAKASVSNLKCVSPFLGSIALNNVLPLRAGDVMRAFVFPSSMGVSMVTSTASLFLERLLDLSTLLVCLATGLYFTQHVALPDAIKTSIFVMAVVAFCAFFLMLSCNRVVSRLMRYAASRLQKRRYAMAGKIICFFAEFFERLSEMISIKQLFTIFSLSMLIWVFEAGLFKSILDGLSVQVSLLDALGIMAITTLATLVPSSPGYVGPFHVVAFSALSAFSVQSSDAASFAILSHLALWLPTTLAGVIAILCNKQLFQGIRIKEKGVKNESI